VGRPQFFALLLLLAFFAQCVWMVYQQGWEVSEFVLLEAGKAQWATPNQPPPVTITDPLRLPWEGEPGAYKEAHSPLVALLAARWRECTKDSRISLEPEVYHSLDPLIDERLPFALAGLLLDWSLWHVARRLYGNTGGYIALALYSFSPLMIVASAEVGHDIIAAWGLFGAVFTAIALAHTLLAPPEDRIRRTMLLGVALGMGVGADYSVAMAIPLVLALMLYLAPERRAAAAAWLAAASGVALLLLWAAFFFDGEAMIAALRQARFFALRPTEVARGIPYNALVIWLVATLPALVLFAVALMGFARSRRSRYFGNALPLAIGGALFVMSLATPYYLSVKYLIWALPFLYLFGAGVFADLLEEAQSRRWASITVLAVLVANAVGCVTFLAKLV